jgi:catalase
LTESTEEKRGFETATSDAFDMFQSILKIKMLTVRVNGDEMAWVCNAPKAPVHSYSKDGVMRVIPVSDPVYAPNSKGGPQADPTRAAEALWHADGEMMRSAYALRAGDDDWGQAAVLVRDVMNDAERERLVNNVAGHLRNGVSEQVLERAFEYWKNTDKETGDRIETVVRSGLGSS